MAASSLNAGMMTLTDEGSAKLGCVTEINHVAVLHDVLLALEPDLRVLAARGERAPPKQRIAPHDLGANEAALNVAVNFPGRQLRVSAAGDGPRAIFILADGEKRDITQQIVAGANHAVEPGFGKAEVGEKRLGVGLVELR